MSTSIAVPQSTTARRETRTLDLMVAGLMLLLIGIYLFPGMLVVIGPGEAGVLWDRFYGTRPNVVYGEGLHLMAPWNRMFIYDVRLQESTNEYEVLAQTGLYVKVVASIRYRPAGAPFERTVNRGSSAADSLPELHKRVGPDYRDKLVLPVVAAAIRQVIGRFQAEELYHLQPQLIQEEIVEIVADRRLKEQFAEERYVDVLEVLIRSITLPESVQQSIQEKLREEQSMLAFDFTIRKEQKEAERKQIEAGGIRDFQAAVIPGINNDYLRWKGIEATMALARSQNSKIVVFGNSDGLPVILNIPPDGTAAASVTVPAGQDSPPAAARSGTASPDGTAAVSPSAAGAAAPVGQPAPPVQTP